MNIRRGLLRLWIALTVLWLAAVGALFLPNIIKNREAIAEFDRETARSITTAPPGFELLVPWDCAQARGVKSESSDRMPPGTDYSQDSSGFCLYLITGFKKLFPEQASGASDQDLYRRLWWTYGQGSGPRDLPEDPSRTERTAAAIAFAPPLFLFLLGLTAMWIIRGFRA